jgi:hypothetical protein
MEGKSNDIADTIDAGTAAAMAHACRATGHVGARDE